MQISVQDAPAYGSEIGTKLGQLLERLVQIPGDFMLRLGMMNPNSVLFIKDQLLRAYLSLKIYRTSHVPVRSAHSKITIVTDVVVGYPDETDGDSIETLDIVKRLQSDKVNIARFSVRPGHASGQALRHAGSYQEEQIER